MVFENSLPKAYFGQNIRDSPNGSFTADSRSLQTATLNTSKRVDFISLPGRAIYSYFSVVKFFLEPIVVLLEDQRSKASCERHSQATFLFLGLA